MKKNGLNKLLALLLALVMVLALAACGNKEQDKGGAGDDANVVTDGVVADGATVGEGKTAFTVEVVQLDGTAIKFTVNTDKATVGEALLDLGIVAGDTTEYGLYVKTVNGVTLDYDADGAYWAFYINGEYASTGVDSTNIEAGATYTLKGESAITTNEG